MLEAFFLLIWPLIVIYALSALGVVIRHYLGIREPRSRTTYKAESSRRDEYDHHDHYSNSSKKKSSGSSSKRREEFEEADSYYDRRGNEHIVDDDGYCEDCDDYHDN